jgi:pyridoxal phosphate enzyme (YggS family)
MSFSLSPSDERARAEAAQAAGDEAAAIAARLDAIKGRLAKAASAAGRDAKAVSLIAVTKGQPASRIEAALKAGQRRFGENRVQEAEMKWPALRAAYPGVALHLIGPLQTNKVRQAVALFDVIETVDREKLARHLAEEMARTGRRPDLLIEVNTGEEPQKAGVVPAEADAFIAHCRGELNLPVKGLMCIPPQGDEPSFHFALLAKIAARNRLAVVSMGMSGDFEVAAAFGATAVRIGTAIFGARSKV